MPAGGADGSRWCLMRREGENEALPRAVDADTSGVHRG